MPPANPHRFVEFMLPADVIEAAAERATQEEKSLRDVAATLLRDYTAGRTWLNLPGAMSDNDPCAAAENLAWLFDAGFDVTIGTRTTVGGGQAYVIRLGGEPFGDGHPTLAAAAAAARQQAEQDQAAVGSATSAGQNQEV